MIPKFRVFIKSEAKISVVRKIDYENNIVWVKEFFHTPETAVTEYTPFELDEVILMQYTPFEAVNTDDLVCESDVVNIHWFYTAHDEKTYGAYEAEETAERVVITKEHGNLGFWWDEADVWVDLATLNTRYELHEESFEVVGNIYEHINGVN